MPGSPNSQFRGEKGGWGQPGGGNPNPFGGGGGGAPGKGGGFNGGGFPGGGGYPNRPPMQNSFPTGNGRAGGNSAWPTTPTSGGGAWPASDDTFGFGGTNGANSNGWPSSGGGDGRSRGCDFSPPRSGFDGQHRSS